MHGAANGEHPIITISRPSQIAGPCKNTPHHQGAEMTPQICEKEQAVLAALQQGNLSGDLFVHFESCPVCSEIVMTVEGLRPEAARLDSNLRPPNPAVIFRQSPATRARGSTGARDVANTDHSGLHCCCQHPFRTVADCLPHETALGTSLAEARLLYYAPFKFQGLTCREE